MNKQNKIQQQLLQPESIEYLCNLINDLEKDIYKTQLAKIVCEHFEFLNPSGNAQITSCLFVLRQLARAGKIPLPISRGSSSGKKKNTCRSSKAVPSAQGVPSEVENVDNLKIIMVQTDEELRTWNELMIQDHPNGAAILVGRQVKYLITSDHGLLGGLAFSSAAYQLEARDKWIGWDKDLKDNYLHYIVNLSRFLIRSDISCRNLASKILGMAINQLPKDFESRYGYRPLLLETFLDIKQYSGTCYRAANWEFIGYTKGRGRQDFFNNYQKDIKGIYVYPLKDNFRLEFGLSNRTGVEAIQIGEGLDNCNWVRNEFYGACLGDLRLSNRLIEIADIKAKQPGSSYSDAAGGKWSIVKAYYRFIEQPDESKVTMENILEPHRNRTKLRMASEETVLCIQDGSDLNFNNLNKCQNLGGIGSNQTGTKSLGLHLHSMLAITAEGLPLGILHSRCNAPESRAEEDQRSTETIPIEEKKNYCWIEGIRDCAKIQSTMPETSVINVMDREADFFELFDDWRLNSNNIELLVRAKYNRKTTGEYNLFETVKETPVQEKVNISVPRQSARPKKSKQKKRPKQPARTAETSIRYTQVELNPPSTHKAKNPIQLCIVHVLEENSPSDVEPLEWYLLTTKNIQSVDDALQVVKWYSKRWRIEDWHRVLKAGCKAEEVANKTAERLKRTIAINMVIAWRIMLMTLLGREVPHVSAEILFSDLEIEVLNAYAKKKGLSQAENLYKAIKLVAKIGGYLNRRSDPPPGHQIMWRGYTQLQLMCEGYSLKGG